MYKGRALKSTTGPGFRPAMGAVREALFSTLESRDIIWEETRILDLFAGSGSLGFEALSRGAAHVCFVDAAAYAAKVITSNAVTFGVSPERYNVVNSDTGKMLGKRAPAPYDLVFIDPPYKDTVLAYTVKKLLANGWVKPGALINAEIESRQRIAPEAVHPELVLHADRSYGQTRVLIWEVSQP